MSHSLDALLALGGAVVRGGAGLRQRPIEGAPRPERLLELYEFENCPFCRKVRDALTELGLSARVYPCPKGGTRFRPQAIERAGKRMFPFLVDPNTGVEMQESDDINSYLFEHYAQPSQRAGLRLVGPAANTLSALASGARPTRGHRARPSRAPERPLVLYSFESSPFCRLVRETLCELELPYDLHNLGKVRTLDFIPAKLRARLGDRLPVEGAQRQRFQEKTGMMMVPYLEDPNTGFAGFESARLCAYLEETYALG